MDIILYVTITAVYLITIFVIWAMARHDIRKMRDISEFWKEEARIGADEALRWQSKCQLFEATKLKNPNIERNKRIND